jgi:hypothetical protein
VLNGRGTIIVFCGGVGSDRSARTPTESSRDASAIELSEALRQEHVDDDAPSGA